ncbi:MAG TPA: LacI family DNA-binding transcriptional regulator [Armatimonadaceae bacterium]|nr:LacI family DNA-binding transcriptional regulator [Armatimonadaceae bacterium]
MRKPPTIDDVALALGMHKSTVSKALSDKGNISHATKVRVREAARELGYEPNPLAQRLANGYRNPMVYIFSGTLDVGVATQKIRLIQQELNAASLEVPIYTCPESGGGAAAQQRSQAAQIKQLCRQRPRAIVCAVQMVGEDVFSELAAYQREGGIVVSYDTPIPLECDQVVFDREDNAYRAAKHLLEWGHRKIGIGMSRTSLPLLLDPAAAGLPQSGRMRGFRRALDEFGVPLRAEWFFENAPYEEGGEEMARRFLSLEDRPTGLCIVNDYVAFAFMVDVMKAGVRVPGDVSIVAHDNQRIASRCPVPMTSATHPVEQIAQSVVAMLLDRIEGYDGPPRTETVRGELVVRGSAAPPSDDRPS